MFHPEREKVTAYEWSPSYSEGSLHFTLDSAVCRECPASLLQRYPEAVQLAEQIVHLRAATQTGAASWHGADLSRWPVLDLDAWVVIQEEVNRVANARTEAIEREAEKNRG